MDYDLIIQNGRIADGSGAPCFYGDIGVLDGCIREVGPLGTRTAKTKVDAEGRVVAPGFIDPHAHDELSAWGHGGCLPKVSQGITTVLTGQCGISAFPAPAAVARDIARYAAPVLGDQGDWPWETLEQYIHTLSHQGTAINIGTFIGHGNLRISAMGFADRKAYQDQLDHMAALLRRELASGAFGLSSGLVYAPGAYSNQAEMTALASLCAEVGGLYTTHMRNEGSRLLESVEEALAVAKASGVRLIISHLKAQGRPNHGKVAKALALIDKAVAEGCRVWGDCYPYDAASTTMTIVLPPWTLAEGTEGLLAHLAQKDSRQRILDAFASGLEGWDNRSRILGWENIRIASLGSAKNKKLEGLSLLELGGLWQRDPGVALLDLLLEEKAQVTALLRGMADADIRAALAHPRVMVCTDGIPVSGKPHPRLYGAVTRYLGRYADLSNDEAIGHAIHKLTGLPAQAYGLAGLGLLEPGCRADITILEPDRVADRATYTDPTLLSDGIWQVYNGGQLIYSQGAVSQARPGLFLRRGERLNP